MSTPKHLGSITAVPKFEFVSHGGRSFFTLINGEVFACGDNEHGQLGLGINEKYIVRPRAVVLLGEAKVENIIFNGDFTIFMIENGGICFCGIDKYGFLGEPGSEIYTPIVSLKLFQVG